MTTPAWQPPSMRGKVVVVTGATSGIGQAAARQMAAAGATVVLAARDREKSRATADTILRRHPGAAIEQLPLDLADLHSVRAFAERAAADLPRIDVLLNNAGLGMQPDRRLTADGFERQFGTNHLGHFALTALLVPALLRAPHPRVVWISSIAHARGRIDFRDPHAERSYEGRRVYAQSKLANLVTALELDRRARAAYSPLSSLAAHPGLSATGFIAATDLPRPVQFLADLGFRVLGQDAEDGASPGVYAASVPALDGGSYWGPAGRGEFRGPPARARIHAHARDPDVARRLWAMSEAMTGIRFPALSVGS
ncbi:MAG: SDR family oxidoreductase [Gluconacetobacter diazotrophicus]|nr:SDR family oxidoreductase [Gluconacetobacter diazotrophicus]